MEKTGISTCAAAILFILLAVISCSSRTAPSPSLIKSPESVRPGTGTGESAATSRRGAREPWETIWETTLQTARKEKKVIVFGAAAAGVRTALVESFNAKYGIDLEYVAISGPEAVAQIQTQRRNGLYNVDVLLGAGGPGSSILKPAGAFDTLEPALILPEVTNGKNWWQGKLPWADADHYRLAFSLYVSSPLGINTQMVKPEEVSSWKNLLEPRWKGKMTIVDPTKSTSGNVIIASLAWKLMGMDYVRELAKQELIISADRRLTVEWVARGKYPVVIAPYSETVQEFVQVGAPLKEIIPKEGSHLTAGSGYLSLMNRAPHPNAAKVFINWLLTREVQTLYSKEMGVQSSREDVPTEHLSPIIIHHDGVPYYGTWEEDFLLTSNERLKLGLEIFGPYMK